MFLEMIRLVNPFKLLQKQIKLCRYCHKPIVGYYKWKRHEAKCKRKHEVEDTFRKLKNRSSQKERQ